MTYSVELEGPLSGPENMAADAALLDQLSQLPIAARVYSWDGPWVSLGKFQKPERDLKPGAGIPWVMRPTGGRAVLHGHDITIGLAIALSAIQEDGESIEVLSRSVRRVYRRAVAPIILAMRECGVDAALGESIKGAERTPRSADCFAHVAANDIVDLRTLNKACGVAMLLTSEAVLIQASLPAGPPLVDPSRVYEAAADPTWLEIEPESFASALEQALKSFVTT